MTTSWTQADIEAMEAAVKRGVLRVRFQDREVQYQSSSEMLKVLDAMRTSVDSTATPGATRTTYARFSKGSI